jgi:endonuclease/exonuclease/phosphatase family metal-dependent hydrolase
MKKILFLLLICWMHSLSAQNKSFTVAFYNLENLFDTIDSPDTDDAEFLPGEGWTSERYQKKIKQLSRVIDTLGSEKGPDFLGVCETENKLVLQDLIQAPLLQDNRFSIIHEESGDARGIDVGFLYNSAVFTVLKHQAFRLYMPDTQIVRTRDVLWVLGTLSSKDTIGFFVCHWPSRRGAERAEKYRQYIGNRVREITDSLAVLYPSASWILMGDLNDEPSDLSVRKELAAAPNQDSACLAHAYYNPMSAIQEKGDGTHSYKQEWNVLDQILIRCPLKSKKHFRIEEGSAEVYRPKWMQSTHVKYFGEPYRTFAGKNYLGGFSDHFPVFVRISKK